MGRPFSSERKIPVRITLDQEVVEFAQHFGAKLAIDDNLSLSINTILKRAKRLGIDQFLSATQNNYDGNNTINHDKVLNQKNFNGATFHTESLTINDEIPAKKPQKRRRK